MSRSAMVAPPAWSLEAGRGDDGGDGASLGRLLAFGAARHPDKVAIDDGRRRFTFGELDAMSQRLAAHLAANGVEPRDRVAVIAEKRSIMPVIAVAIWACGAVYVPLDGEVPEARLLAILGRVRPRIVISLRGSGVPDGFSGVGRDELEAIALDVASSRFADPCRMAGTDPAYILFTSGSTGVPKGVEISTGSLLAYFRAHNEVLRFTATSRVISFTPFHFDVSIEDTLLPLSLGAFVYQYRGVLAGGLVRRTLARERITHLIAVSTVLTLISQPFAAVRAEVFPDLGMIMTGAEVCDPKIINLWKERLPGCRLINAYGPTEATIVCLCHTIEAPEPERASAFPIGRPLAGVHCLVLDRDGNEVADGEHGELCVGGAQVMEGYFDQPSETARALFERNGVRYYRTGDVCYRQPDGSVVYVGRDDDEVKIAGRRVHLGELRQAVLSLPDVDRVAVGTIDRGGRREIAIVIISADEAILARASGHVARRLPAYMRPSVWGHGRGVSLGATGKTDEKRLLARITALAAASRRTVFRIEDDGTIAPAAERADD